MADVDDLMSVTEYATFRGLSRVTVYRAIHQGHIQPAYIGGRKTPYIDADKYKNFTPAGKVRGVGRSNWQKVNPGQKGEERTSVIASDGLQSLWDYPFGLTISLYNDAIEAIAVELEKENSFVLPDLPSYTPFAVEQEEDDDVFEEPHATELPMSPVDALVDIAVNFINSKTTDRWDKSNYILHMKRKLTDTIGDY